MGFKVPIGYRQIDDTRNTEVVYDDNTTWDWVNGSGGGDEGDDSMLVNMTNTDDGVKLDKNYNEIVAALNAGKVVIGIDDNSEEFDAVYYWYVTRTEVITGVAYLVTFACAYEAGGDFSGLVKVFASDTATGELIW